MPIYEFICSACAHRFECLIRSSQEAEILCPECGSAAVKKVFSTFGIGGGSSRIKSTSGASCTSCSTKSCSTCK